MPAFLDFLAGGLLQAGWGALAGLPPGRHPAHHLLGDAVPASQPGASRRGLPSGARALLPLLDLADHLDDHQGMGGDPSQAPRQVRDRGRSAQPACIKGIKHRVLARRRAVPRSARRSRGDREVRQGLPGRLDRAPPLHAARDDGPDRCCCSSASRCSASPASRCGRSRWRGSRSGPPAWSTASATGGATATSRPTDTATNLTPWGVWIGGEELHNNHHAFPSSAKFALRKWEFDIGWAAIKLFESGRPGQGAARRAVARRAPEHRRARRRNAARRCWRIRFQAMTDYQRNVLKPALREEAAAAGAKLRALLPRKLRKGLADDGRWLEAGRARSSCRPGSRSARASARWSNTARAWPRCSKRAATTPPATLQQPAGLVPRGRGQRHPRAAGVLGAAEGLCAAARARLMRAPLHARCTTQARAAMRGLFHVRGLAAAVAGVRAAARRRSLPPATTSRAWTPTATAASRWSNTRTG